MAVKGDPKGPPLSYERAGPYAGGGGCWPTIPITLPPHNYSVVRYPAPKISRPESWIGRMNVSDTGF